MAQVLFKIVTNQKGPEYVVPVRSISKEPYIEVGQKLSSGMPKKEKNNSYFDQLWCTWSIIQLDSKAKPEHDGEEHQDQIPEILCPTRTSQSNLCNSIIKRFNKALSLHNMKH